MPWGVQAEGVRVCGERAGERERVGSRSVCACVCVRERERERARAKERARARERVRERKDLSAELYSETGVALRAVAFTNSHRMQQVIRGGYRR
jgi:hypothetical protein